MSETQNQFPLTRAALSTGGRAKSKFLSVQWHPLFSRLGHPPIPRRAAVMLLALAWSSLAFSGEIHDAAI